MPKYLVHVNRLSVIRVEADNAELARANWHDGETVRVSDGVPTGTVTRELDGSTVVTMTRPRITRPILSTATERVISDSFKQIREFMTAARVVEGVTFDQIERASNMPRMQDAIDYIEELAGLKACSLAHQQFAGFTWGLASVHRRSEKIQTWLQYEAWADREADAAVGNVGVETH